MDLFLEGIDVVSGAVWQHGFVIWKNRCSKRALLAAWICSLKESVQPAAALTLNTQTSKG
ncbi:hypothetical protein [Bacillus sp. P14.5]|uniref:hypothetical protein n=1 Tax=Bacillus sp. P14.5 TaxID=1983400 RepID=UPI000DE8A22A|nr:hypothetical protein [Bacillus sp. P14.5]